MVFLFILQEQEPMWLTMLAAILFFFIYFFFMLPAELERKEREDKRYAESKGISYEELNRRRSLRRARTIRGSVRKYVMARDNYTCQYCGSQENPVIDHIFPFSRGGSNEADNLQVLCRDCNARKSDSIPSQFRDKK